MNTSHTLATQFREEGYVVLRGLLSSDETQHYRRLLQEISNRGDAAYDDQKSVELGWALADGVTQRKQFWPLIVHKKLVETARTLLGPTARYTQHSDLHVHHGSVGWHRDSKDRNFGVGGDWDESVEEYLVARVAIYLQSFEESGFQLGVIPGSHRYESPLTKLEIKAWNRALGWRPGGVLPPLMTVRPTWIPIEKGDCVIFNQRLYHSGSRVHGPKYAIYLSYGTENEHSRNHVRYYRYEREDLKHFYTPPAQPLEQLLRSEQLFLEV